MAKYLVIVESPAKVKTIKKFLGTNYDVIASMGHVRDLPKSTLGIDVEHGFEPKYITIRGKGELLAALRKAARKAEKIYLATDPDREGEAISWHLKAALKQDADKMLRISFNEITKTAVKASIKQARDLDMNLVDAQQARRMLDRMVGYEISPVLWKKVKRGLSAGRVQSVTLRIIADREEEINAFIPQEYWTLDADFSGSDMKKTLPAKLVSRKGEKAAIRNEAEMKEILDELQGQEAVVSEVKRGERTRKAPLPFTTSTLQQEASKVLNFSTQKTMRIAQQLYEGVEVKGHGTIALISYLRTDSTRISAEADQAAREYIREVYGSEFEASGDVNGNRNSQAQDAHEAIRPTNIRLTPMDVKDSLQRDQFRLYQLIWKRFTASRMQNVRYETVSAHIRMGDCEFSSATSRILFEGFLCVYSDQDEKKDGNSQVRMLEKGTALGVSALHPQQHFTQPPAHYTEASLVKTMEELGIGRPSTYAPTITLLLNRRYIAKENKNLYLTEIGEVVNNVMKQAFISIVDVNFTATMEALLDKVEDGTINWKVVVENFWPDLADAVAEAEKELAEMKVEDEVTDVICENCGRNMVVKYGPHGKFLACPGFPDCRNTKPYLEKVGVSCPKCGGEIVLRKTKKGRKFYGCENSPECDFLSWQCPVKDPCPNCGKFMVRKGNRVTCSDETCGYIRMQSPAELND